MSRPAALLVLLALLTPGCGGGAPSNEQAADSKRPEAAQPPRPRAPEADIVRVRLETGAGPILLALDAKRAPVTSANFLAYVDQQRFDGTTFYRAARTPGARGGGLIQGGINRSYRRMLLPIAHEPTGKTGLRHQAGTISMARAKPGSAAGEFFITASAMPKMDSRGGEPGFAAFGRVTDGMDVVRTILAAPTVPNAGRGVMRGQMIAKPVRIVSARRAD